MFISFNGNTFVETMMLQITKYNFHAMTSNLNHWKTWECLVYIAAPVSLYQNERGTFYATKFYNALCHPFKE